jgi:hypothetical protein
MKTKELIKLLQEVDPAGETEVCVHNNDILFVDCEPAYYDGTLERLEVKNGRIVGAKYVRKGSKVRIHPLSISDAIGDNEFLPVDLNDRPEYASLVERYRRETRELRDGSERHSFVLYVRRKYSLSSRFDDVSEEFYNKNLSYLDPMPSDIVKLNMNWHDRRCKQWDRELSFEINGDELIIQKK